MIRGLCQLFCVTALAGAVFAPTVFADAPTTRPTARPTEAQLIGDLGSPDPAVRDSARSQLMLLSRDELPKLVDAVKQRGRLSIQQVQLLHECVLQSYMTGEHNFTQAETGRSPQPRVGIRFVTQSAQPIVENREMGCDAYRTLRDGDFVIAAYRPKEPGSAEMFWQNINTADDLRGVLRNYYSVGDFVSLRVIRNGAPVEVEVRLAPPPAQRPGDDGLTDQLALTRQAQAKAEEYWKRTFVPLLSANSNPNPSSPAEPNGKP
ncbi:MAG: hypothetical protein QM770_00050 [Tepidisphaeraceae bacterium]